MENFLGLFRGECISFGFYAFLPVCVHANIRRALFCFVHHAFLRRESYLSNYLQFLWQHRPFSLIRNEIAGQKKKKNGRRKKANVRAWNDWASSPYSRAGRGSELLKSQDFKIHPFKFGTNQFDSWRKRICEQMEDGYNWSILRFLLQIWKNA